MFLLVNFILPILDIYLLGAICFFEAKIYEVCRSYLQPSAT